MRGSRTRHSLPLLTTQITIGYLGVVHSKHGFDPLSSRVLAQHMMISALYQKAGSLLRAIPSLKRSAMLISKVTASYHWLLSLSKHIEIVFIRELRPDSPRLNVLSTILSDVTISLHKVFVLSSRLPHMRALRSLNHVNNSTVFQILLSVPWL